MCVWVAGGHSLSPEVRLKPVVPCCPPGSQAQVQVSLVLQEEVEGRQGRLLTKWQCKPRPPGGHLGPSCLWALERVAEGEASDLCPAVADGKPPEREAGSPLSFPRVWPRGLDLWLGQRTRSARNSEVFFLLWSPKARRGQCLCKATQQVLQTNPIWYLA